MPNTKYYLVFDCETCTMDFVDALAGGNADKKKKMAIARPLIYDMGWTICDRKGTIYKRQQYLVAETFSVPSVFNTAYYKEKRPIYLEMIKNGLIQVLPWSQCISELIQDMENVSAVGAFNSMFDFKKATTPGTPSLSANATDFSILLHFPNKAPEKSPALCYDFH